MTYAIAKATYCGTAKFYVTRILQGGLRIDNARVENGKDPWQARKFKTLASANAAREKLARVGLYDDYHVIEVA